ncbi:hypothetical protein ZWY2020_006825, partial [Hordeum vulgare]
NGQVRFCFVGCCHGGGDGVCCFVAGGASRWPGAGAEPSFPNPWLAFQNLSGCHMGDRRDRLARLKDYLSHFGYLSGADLVAVQRRVRRRAGRP